MPAAQTETFSLGPLHDLPRLFVGLWQLSGNAWGSASVPKVRKAMTHHAELGFTAFADHYGSAEIIFGQFRRSMPPASNIVGSTKWCVFGPLDPTSEVVKEAVFERMERMESKDVDILQFHWNDYDDRRYLVALERLKDLADQGYIRALALCNFDTLRTEEICTHLGPDAIVSNQVQFSLIDIRPLHGMNLVCQKHGLKLLTYGTLCGGFLADKYLDQPEPDLYSSSLTPSQRKYLDVILKIWGSWPLFQELLRVLRAIGDRHGNVSIANVATRWVLDFDFVGAVLVGARLGISDNVEDNLRVYGWRLSDEDRADINAVLAKTNSSRMISLIGDCGAEYR